MNDSDWAKKVLREYQASLAEQTRQKAESAERQRVLEESTANLFSALRAAFDAKVQIINDGLGREAISFSYQSGSYSFSITRNPPNKTKTVTIRCDKSVHRFTVSIHGKTPGDVRHLTVEVNDGAGVGFLAENGESTTPSEIAETTIESLLVIEATTQ